MKVAPDRRRRGPRRAASERRKGPRPASTDRVQPLRDPARRMVPRPLARHLGRGAAALSRGLVAVLEDVPQELREVLRIRIGPAEAVVVRGARVRRDGSADPQRIRDPARGRTPCARPNRSRSWAARRPSPPSAACPSPRRAPPRRSSPPSGRAMPSWWYGNSRLWRNAMRPPPAESPSASICAPDARRPCCR